MSKTDFIKEQLALRGIYNYTEKDLKFLKTTMIEAIHHGRDRYQAFEDAFKLWRRKCLNQ